MNLDRLPPDPFSYSAALARGVTRQQLRTAVRLGHLYSPARGWYARAGEAHEIAERWEVIRADHLRRLDMALHTYRGAVASHDSAAIVHGLPLMVSPRAEVHLVHVEDYPTSRRLPGVILHHADSGPTQVEEVDGRRVTSAARAAADVMRTRRVPHSLAMLDQALRERTLTLEEVEATLAGQRRWVGKTRAREVLSLVDVRRESWAESFSYGVLAAADLPLPIPQVEVLDEGFDFAARVDGFLEGYNAYFEVHGLGKFFIGTSASEPDETERMVRARVEAEESRIERLGRLGLAGAEWTADEALRSPEVVPRRMLRAMEQGEQQTFTGWVRWEGRICRPPLLPRAA